MKKEFKDAWMVLKGVTDERSFLQITNGFGITQESSPELFSQARQIWEEGGTVPLMSWLQENKIE
jgi:hypothetical protein